MSQAHGSPRRERGSAPDGPPALGALLERALAELAAAVDDPGHGFHWPVVSTVGPDGRPRSRVVVLRSLDAVRGTLTFHTDRRSPKCAEVEGEPRVAVLFHDGPRKLQVRAEGSARVLTAGPVADAGWERIGRGSRRCYLAPHAPSTPAADGPTPNLPEEFVGRIPTEEQCARGRAQFAVVQVELRALDVLELHRLGHERALFEFAAGGALEHAAWLQP